MVRSVAAASSFQSHARLRLAESLTLSSLRSKCAALMKGTFLFWVMRGYLLRGDGKSASGRKIPYRITMRQGAPFALAGIWQAEGGGSALPGFAIITTVANAVVSPIHHRMPVILRPDQKSDWLSSALGYQELLGMLRPITMRRFAYEVSPLVNRAF